MNIFSIGILIAIILFIETVFLKNKYVKWILLEISCLLFPVIVFIMESIYIKLHRNLPQFEGIGSLPIYSLLALLLVIFFYSILSIYFFVKIVIKLIKKEKLKE